jgi:mRNA-degrading endonuclease RelE of RelBE toxin-antitoxin system
MGRHVVFRDKAKAQLRAMDQSTALRILKAIARFLATGEGDVRTLQGIDPPELRLRVGDYRVLFHDLGDAIEVLSVKHRREAYR